VPFLLERSWHSLLERSSKGRDDPNRLNFDKAPTNRDWFVAVGASSESEAIILYEVSEGLTRDILVARAVPSFTVQKRYPAFLSNPLVGLQSNGFKVRGSALMRGCVL